MVVIITGANRGIGLEFVRKYKARGDTVIATARDPQGATDLQALAQDSAGVEVAELDVSDTASIARFASAVGDRSVDVLINNAGVYPRDGRFGDLDYEAMLQGLTVNTMGPMRLAEALLGQLERDAGGAVVNITSQMGSIGDNSSGGSYAYRMSKAALNMATRSMSHDLKGRQIVAMVMHPGWVQTDMGGPNATITAEQSVDGMMSLIDALGPEHSGKFYSWSGSQIEW